jgi:hypothetical protein
MAASKQTVAKVAQHNRWGPTRGDYMNQVPQGPSEQESSCEAT